MSFVCFNGDFIESNKPFLSADNRSFKYGDGVFETILFLNEKIILVDYHFERLFNSLQFLHIRFNHLSQDVLEEKIYVLSKKNKINPCRIRLTVYRDEGDNASYVIETTEIPFNVHEFNAEGWNINLYPFARKGIDAFSNLKSISYQQYIMAARYAGENALNESIILNAGNRVCEGSKTNIFLFKNKQVMTPALYEGCVNGVMRRHVIDIIKKAGIPVQQIAIKEEDILNSDEVFLTNSIQVVKWVKNFKSKTFSSSFSKEVSERTLATF